MAADFEVTLTGVEELKAALRGLPEKLRRRVLLGALRRAGQVISREAKIVAPILAVPTKTRTPGTVRKRISVRTSKYARQAGDVGVFVGVKPLRGSADTRRYGKASAKNPHDPYYWRFVEFPTKRAGGQRPFLTPAAKSRGEEAIDTFMREVVPQIEKLNRKGS